MQQYFCDFLWTNLIEMEIVMQSPANPRSPQLRVSRQAVKGNLFNIPETDSGHGSGVDPDLDTASHATRRKTRGRSEWKIVLEETLATFRT